MTELVDDLEEIKKSVNKAIECYLTEKQISEHDPKYLGIPNICFSLTKTMDEREQQFSQQRLERGFDDSETWGLYSSIAKFILPRLRCFQEICTSWLDEEEHKNINKMITGFSLVTDDEHDMTNEDYEVVYEALDIFAKEFFSLWW